MGIHLSILEVEVDLRNTRANLCPPEEATRCFSVLRRTVRLEDVWQLRLVVGGTEVHEKDTTAEERRRELMVVR